MKKEQQKDFAEKDWLKYTLESDDDDWQEVDNKEFCRIVKYFMFTVVSLSCGYIFMIGVLS